MNTTTSDLRHGLDNGWTEEMVRHPFKVRGRRVPAEQWSGVFAGQQVTVTLFRVDDGHSWFVDVDGDGWHNRGQLHATRTDALDYPARIIDEIIACDGQLEGVLIPKSETTVGV